MRVQRHAACGILIDVAPQAPNPRLHPRCRGKTYPLETRIQLDEPGPTGARCRRKRPPSSKVEAERRPVRVDRRKRPPDRTRLPQADRASMVVDREGDAPQSHRRLPRTAMPATAKPPLGRVRRRRRDRCCGGAAAGQPSRRLR